MEPSSNADELQRQRVSIEEAHVATAANAHQPPELHQPQPASSNAHAPTSTRSRSFLADVEIHCVFHFLTSVQRLRLARSNRRLLQAASSAFAWKHVTLKLTDMNAARFAQSRFAPCVLVALHLSRPLCRAVDVTAWLSLHLQLRELDATLADGITPQLWHRILADPALKGLRVLRMQELMKKRALDAEALRLVSLLPHLHTLALSVVASCPAVAFGVLANAPALTNLQINDCLFHRGHSRLPLIANCSRLTSLAVSEPTLSAEMLVTMPTLTSLSFSNYRYATGFVVAMTRDDYVRFFTPMLHLTSLTLFDCFGVSQLISAAVHATSLRSLVISMCATDETLTADLILTVLSSSSKLRVSLRFNVTCFRPFDFYTVQFSRFLPAAAASDSAAPVVDQRILERVTVGIGSEAIFG